MGRVQTFDRATVVRAARDVFWDRGYEPTSVADLERATGLNRSSLYHEFGSKRRLFDVAVADYLDAVARPRLRALLGGPADASGLSAYFDSLRDSLEGSVDDTVLDDTVLDDTVVDRAVVDRAVVRTSRRGCLLVNCAAGLAGYDAGARTVVDDYRAELTSALRHALAAAAPAAPHDVAAETRLDDRARALASMSMSAMLLARVNLGEARAVLEAARNEAIRWMGNPDAGDAHR